MLMTATRLTQSNSLRPVGNATLANKMP